MKALEMPPEKVELYRLLNQQREFVIDKGTGNLVRREAWQEIDRLLDCLTDLGRMAMGVEL